MFSFSGDDPFSGRVCVVCMIQILPQINVSFLRNLFFDKVIIFVFGLKNFSRPYARLKCTRKLGKKLKMAKMTIFRHGRQGSPRVSKVPGGPQGWVRWVITRSIIFKSFSYTIFKIGQFPHWNPPKSPLKTKMACNLSFLEPDYCLGPYRITEKI